MTPLSLTAVQSYSTVWPVGDVRRALSSVGAEGSRCSPSAFSLVTSPHFPSGFLHGSLQARSYIEQRSLKAASATIVHTAVLSYVLSFSWNEPAAPTWGFTSVRSIELRYEINQLKKISNHSKRNDSAKTYKTGRACILAHLLREKVIMVSRPIEIA